MVLFCLFFFFLHPPPLFWAHEFSISLAPSHRSSAQTNARSSYSIYRRFSRRTLSSRASESSTARILRQNYRWCTCLINLPTTRFTRHLCRRSVNTWNMKIGSIFTSTISNYCCLSCHCGRVRNQHGGFVSVLMVRFGLFRFVWNLQQYRYGAKWKQKNARVNAWAVATESTKENKESRNEWPHDCMAEWLTDRLTDWKKWERTNEWMNEWLDE